MIPSMSAGQLGLTRRHSNRKLLLHFDGTDGATTTVDSSIYKHPVVLSNMTLEDTDPKFGATSLYSAGSPGTRQTYALHTHELQIATWPEWTVQMFIKPTSVAAGIRLIASKRANSLSYGSLVWWVNAATMQFYVSQNGTSWGVSDTTAGTIAAGVWQHVALERYADYITAYIDGVVTGGAAITGNMHVNTEAWRIFGEASSNLAYGLGNEFVLDKAALYKGVGFTPPTAPLSP